MAKKFRLVNGGGDSGNNLVEVSEDGKVKLKQTLDYESFPSPARFSIRVRCTDERGHFVEKSFTIDIGDEDEVPSPAPAPTANEIFSSFGGPCGTDSMPMSLRLYTIGSIGANGLKTDSNYVGKFNTNMCSHQINVPNQSYTSGFPDNRALTSYFAAVWDGQIYAPIDGTYEFATVSDDRAIMYIYQGGLSVSHRILIVDDDYRNHGFAWSSRGSIRLTKGLHPFQLRFTQQPPTHLGIVLYWNCNGTGFQNQMVVVPRTSYFGPLAGQMYKLDTANEPNWT